ncbi:MAG: acetate--CoA ligase family protein [Thermoanaerobaculia bacterium]
MRGAHGSTLDPIFSPRSVAVIGASRDPLSLGHALLHNLLSSELQGPVYAVNPRAEFVHSLPCYPSVGAIPGAVDLAVILVPRSKVLAVVEECAAKGVRGVVVISAGFAETGPEGAALEHRLCEVVRTAGMRMIGPNCMGVINTDPAVRLNATFAPVPAHRGSIGFVSQSGALGVAILNVAARLGVGVTQFASMGNKADVSGNDLLEYWEHDPSTRVIAMYLESFGNPRRFAEIAKRVGQSKPILMVKSGRTAAGARAASSHTGAMAGADVTISAFLEQCGVLRARSIEELFDLARAFDRCPLPAGKRVAIVTNAGGPGIMATDACVDLGLEIAELSPATLQTLAGFLPAAASIANPVDMIASATPDDYHRALATVLADAGVDMAMAIFVTPRVGSPMDIVVEVSRAATAAESGKPVLAVMMATAEFYRELHGRRDLPPVYAFPEAAALALSHLDRYAAWRRQPVEVPPALDVDDARVEEILARTAEGYLPPGDALGVLDAYGIPVVEWRSAANREEALEVAAEIGYPVVLKAIAPELIHKSDVGAVALDLRNADELRQALERMDARLLQAGLRNAGSPADGYLLQKLARGGHEVIFGISTDPRFGPLLMFGLGGKYVEVFRDVRFAVTPLSPAEAGHVIRGIRGFKLLEGIRGDAPADVDLLVEMLLRLALLADRHPRIRELDINPFLACSEASESKALDVRIRVDGIS